MPYNLHEAITSVLNDTDLAEPEDVAAKVAENIPSKDLRRVVGELLPAHVRELMRGRRAVNPIIGTQERQRSARSPKVAAIRNAWAEALRDRVHVTGGWKLLGECGYDDLMFAARERREQASRNVAVAARYEALADALRTHEVATVAELPEFEVCAA